MGRHNNSPICTSEVMKARSDLDFTLLYSPSSVTRDWPKLKDMNSNYQICVVLHYMFELCWWILPATIHGSTYNPFCRDSKATFPGRYSGSGIKWCSWSNAVYISKLSVCLCSNSIYVDHWYHAYIHMHKVHMSTVLHLNTTFIHCRNQVYIESNMIDILKVVW